MAVPRERNSKSKSSSTTGSTLLNWGIWGAAIVIFLAIAFQLLSKRRPDVQTSNEPTARSSPEERYRQILLTNPADDRIHFKLARSLQAQGRLDEAIVSYRAAINLRDDVAPYHNDIASALAIQKKYEEAIKHFLMALELEPENVKSLFNLGTALYSNGDLEEAMVQFRKVIALDPTHARAHNNLAVALKDSGQLQEAYKHRYEAMRLEREQQASAP